MLIVKCFRSVTIGNEILMHLRSIKKSRGDVSLYDPIGSDSEGNEINLSDILGTDPDEVSRMVEVSFEYQQLLEQIKTLDNREKKVLELRFGLINGIKKTQREISSMLGISRSYVSRIEKKAVEKIVKSMKV